MSGLAGRVAIVTGVSRRAGIAYTLADRLHRLGATVHATGWPAHDAEMPWGADETGASESWPIERRDLDDPAAPGRLIDDVIAEHGAVDIVLAVHARSSDGGLDTVTADELDHCWTSNVRSIVLLAQRFAARHDASRDGGRMIWFTSGQAHEPMPDEIAYTISKGALHAMTNSVAAALADAGIVANCINPGPVDTGWADDEVRVAVAQRFPSGRWGTPDDVANLVEFLVSDQGAWIQGQVIDSEGGFRRS
jgi:3-oxoacyl-[acyl-carrier protein] reductase